MNKEEIDTLIELKYGRIRTTLTYIDALPDAANKSLIKAWPFINKTNIYDALVAYELGEEIPRIEGFSE